MRAHGQEFQLHDDLIPSPRMAFRQQHVCALKRFSRTALGQVHFNALHAGEKRNFARCIQWLQGIGLGQPDKPSHCVTGTVPVAIGQAPRHLLAERASERPVVTV